MEAIGKSPRTMDNTWREVDMFLEISGVRNKSVKNIDEFKLNDYINKPKRDYRMGTAPAKKTVKDKRKWKKDSDTCTSVGTRRYKLTAIKTFLNYCVAKGWMKTNPALMVRVNIRNVRHSKREPRKKEAFTPEEIRYMVANTEGFWRAAILIGLETGLRMGDIVQLEWDCFTADTVTVWTDKKDKRVNLQMSDRLRKTIAFLPCDDELYLFPEERLDYLSEDEGGRAKRTWFPVTFRRMLLSFGIEGKSFHSLRVTHASRRNQKGEDVEVIAKDLTHSSSRTTKKHYIT